MLQPKLIVHIGAPKCGSSSLQAALSRKPEFWSRGGERYRYAAITSEGEIISGAALKSKAAAALCGYAVSCDVSRIEEFGAAHLAKLTDDLNRLLAESNLILSCEGWFERVGEFQKLGLFKTISADIEVVVYVQPQAEYINASWWQWGAWSGIAFEQWLAPYNREPSCSWATMSYFWSLTEGIRTVHARLKTHDVVSDFFDFLDSEYDRAPILNRSLPGAALRFLQRHRELRPGPEEPTMNFVLAAALKGWTERSPWVLPKAFVERLMQRCRDDNLSLKAMLTPAHADIMSADPRWWDSGSYAGRVVEPAGLLPPESHDLDAFALALANALQDAEVELATLRKL